MGFVPVMTNKAVNCQHVLVVDHDPETHERVCEALAQAGFEPASAKSAEDSERRLIRDGHIVVRAVIDPDEFSAWCRTHSLNTDANVRMRWPNEAAIRHIKESMQNRGVLIRSG